MGCLGCKIQDEKDDETESRLGSSCTKRGSGEPPVHVKGICEVSIWHMGQRRDTCSATHWRDSFKLLEMSE